MRPGIIFMPHGNLQYSQLPPARRAWVARESYGKIFALSEQLDAKLAFEASGETLEIVAQEAPEVMAQLVAGIRAGRIEGVVSPHTHIMMCNVGREVALNSLRDGLDTWERLAGVRPVTGWNPECGWASYLPDVYHEAGFDVRGHSNKNALFKIEPLIAQRPDILRQLFRPNRLDNGLQVIFRSDLLCNIMLWYLMGATEGNRDTPIALEEVRATLARWRARIPDGDGLIMPYAEDAEYVGTTAYFYVKQFGEARFFEHAPESVQRFANILATARELDYELILPRAAAARHAPVPAHRFAAIENGCAWHGGTAKAWANTVYSRALDPLCRSLVDGVQAVAARLGIADLRADLQLREVMRRTTTGYVSDARWPPPPTSPGRFNVVEALDAIASANQLLGEVMEQRGLGAALRHAGHYLSVRQADKKILLLLTDGEPAAITFATPDQAREVRAIERLSGAGRSVVVDALAELEREGVLERRHGRGTYLVETPALTAAGAERLLLVACGLRADHPYLARLLDGLGSAALAQGCTLPVLCLPRGGRRLAALVAAQAPAGLVLCGEVGSRVLAAAVRCQLPLVVAAGIAGPALRCGAAWVGHDDREGGYQAAQHLLALGHRRLAWVGGDTPYQRERRLGLRQALRDAGLSGHHLAFSAGPGLVRSLRRALSAVAAPSALLVGGDDLAPAVYRAAALAGRQVGGDLAVAGFDDLPLASALQPGLTTMRAEIEQVGGEAIRLLHRLMAGGAAEARLLPRSLVRRGSSRPLSRAAGQPTMPA